MNYWQTWSLKFYRMQHHFLGCADRKYLQITGELGDHDIRAGDQMIHHSRTP